VEHGEDSAGIPYSGGEERPHVLQGDRVALLGHYGTHLDVGIGDPEGSELLRGPEEQVVHEAPQAEEGEAERDRRLPEIVRATDGVVGVLDEAVEAQELRDTVAIDGKPGGRQGRRAQRAPVAVLERSREAS
jgi:hypothetical protein